MKMHWIAAVAAALLSTGHAQILSEEALARKVGCFECHTRDKPHIGPSFSDIAARYNNPVQEYDLKFLSVGETRDLPKERKNQIIVARAGKNFHIRIFDGSGEMIVNKKGDRLLEGGDLSGLRKRLEAPMPGDAVEIPAEEKNKLVASAVKAAGHTPLLARDALVQVLSHGGKGKWKAARGVPMPPYLGRLTKAEISRLVDWVLRPLDARLLKVMKTGLGTGTINSTPDHITCGGDCDQLYLSTQTITLTATPDAGSVFSHWEGDATGSLPTVTVTINADKSVRAIFNRAAASPELGDFRPGGIQDYLTANPAVNTPALFISILPREFRLNWILMSRSESLQTGTAKYPRVLLPNESGQAVFSLGMARHSSYPGSHPNAIEYMQWDEGEKNFRFHEIVLDSIGPLGTVPARTRGVSVDDNRCFRCHSTRNVINNSVWPGTSGIPAGTVAVKSKPNWDTYDSWGGMMPFNRDRIYKGSVEAAAFRKIFNPWTWRSEPEVRAIIEQLELQPPDVPEEHDITRTSGGPYDGHIIFPFDDSPTVTIEPLPDGDEDAITTNYSFNAAPGSGPLTSVERQGPFVTLHHSVDPESDEGRGVRFFDTLGGSAGAKLNQRRIADEIRTHRWATGSVPIQVRPVALAIAKGLITVNEVDNVPESASGLTVDFGFFHSRHGGMRINDLVADTLVRSRNLTRRKADIQKINLYRDGDIYRTPLDIPVNGLIEEYGSATTAGGNIGLERLRQEIFRRDPPPGFPDATVMGGHYMDREITDAKTVALFRFFLEPLGVSVDKWSMGVRGRSRTYTFADVFGSYLNTLTVELTDSLRPINGDPVTGLTDPENEAQIITAVNNTLSGLPGAANVPRYTDVQSIFNKSCIECHGGLGYPPFVNYGTFDISENESPPPGQKRLRRAYDNAVAFSGGSPPYLIRRITNPSEECPGYLMPCGGPALAQTDVETIRRWIGGGTPFTVGDPHIRTVDGVSYDFQAAGEFTLLRDEGMELQARHTAINTAGPLGPNAHTGLTTCVSINTAVALRIGSQRITYQPNLNGKPDPEGMQLRVDGELKKAGKEPIPLARGGRILSTIAPGGIQIQAPGGTIIVVTPGWWAHHEVWFLNIDTRQVRASEGLMGSIAPGNWLPALPDGKLLGPRPDDPAQRLNILYKEFGNAWRVTDDNTLFDYAPGTSPKTFIIEDWPGKDSSGECKAPPAAGIVGKPPLKPITKEEAAKLAAEIQDPAHRAHLIEDLMTTGEPVFVKTYLFADQIMRRKAPAPPVLQFPVDQIKGLDKSLSFRWESPKIAAADDAKISNKIYIWHVNDEPDDNKAVPLADASTVQAAALQFKLEPGKAYFWKIIAEDSMGLVTESEIRRFEMK